MFTENDFQQLQAKNIDRETVEQQMHRFKQGFPFMQIEKAATPGNGILQPAEEEKKKWIELFEKLQNQLRILKFVPASGAASRMFKDLYSFLDEAKEHSNPHELLKKDAHRSVYQFFKNIEHFAFFNDLKTTLQSKGVHLEEALLTHQYVLILETLLSEHGLNYGNLPKALLKFHQYPEGSRTSVEEHLVEAAVYGKSRNGEAYIHFTVSPELQQHFSDLLQEVMPAYEEKYQVTYEISYSIQKPSTDTIAATPDNQPFRNEDGSLLFRPGGHGALLENINEFDHDLIFIKNIDNVVPDRLKEPTFDNKKLLGGILLQIQKDLYYYQQKFDLTGEFSTDDVQQAWAFLKHTLCWQPADDAVDTHERVRILREKLFRPLRICGMVKNEGEPGGGPYWARNNDGSISLQVVESSQVNLSDNQQKEVFNNATHFNPVDIACSVKNYKGEKYDLTQFVDPETGFISLKSKDGKDLQALELPGLWNGSMSKWNTLFVEVPVITFNPVKKVNDLLRENHQ